MGTEERNTRERAAPSSGLAAACLAAAMTVGAGLAPTEAVAQQAAPGSQADDRTPVELPAEGRRVVLSEMRQMLAALNGVLSALAEGDRPAAAEAARSGGTRIAVDRGGGMAGMLPEEFMRLGMSTHRGFDALAEAVEGGASRDSLLARMGALTAKCVSCHAGYRLARPDGSAER